MIAAVHGTYVPAAPMNRTAWLLLICQQLPACDPLRMRIEPLLFAELAKQPAPGEA